MQKQLYSILSSQERFSTSKLKSNACSLVDNQTSLFSPAGTAPFLRQKIRTDQSLSASNISNFDHLLENRRHSKPISTSNTGKPACNISSNPLHKSNHSITPKSQYAPTHAAHVETPKKYRTNQSNQSYSSASASKPNQKSQKPPTATTTTTTSSSQPRSAQKLTNKQIPIPQLENNSQKHNLQLNSIVSAVVSVSNSQTPTHASQQQQQQTHSIKQGFFSRVDSIPSPEKRKHTSTVTSSFVTSIEKQATSKRSSIELDFSQSAMLALKRSASPTTPIVTSNQNHAFLPRYYYPPLPQPHSITMQNNNSNYSRNDLEQVLPISATSFDRNIQQQESSRNPEITSDSSQRGEAQQYQQHKLQQVHSNFNSLNFSNNPQQCKHHHSRQPSSSTASSSSPTPTSDQVLQQKELLRLNYYDNQEKIVLHEPTNQSKSTRTESAESLLLSLIENLKNNSNPITNDNLISAHQDLLRIQHSFTNEENDPTFSHSNSEPNTFDGQRDSSLHDNTPNSFVKRTGQLQKHQNNSSRFAPQLVKLVDHFNCSEESVAETIQLYYGNPRNQDDSWLRNKTVTFNELISIQKFVSDSLLVKLDSEKKARLLTEERISQMFLDKEYAINLMEQQYN